MITDVRVQSQDASHDVPDDGAPVYRVWLGWRNNRSHTDGWQAFLNALRTTFIPSTYQVMGRFGLVAYIPSVLAAEQAENIPDETALLVYSSQEQYERAFKSVAGRAYVLLHWAVFNNRGALWPSRSDWAVRHPASPVGKVLSTVWPAVTSGPTLAQADSQIVFLALHHPADPLPTVAAVEAALGASDGERVVCRDGRLSFVWLATRRERSAAAVKNAVLVQMPSWVALAAHDAKGAICNPDGFAPVETDLILEENQTLHLTLP